MATTTRFVPAPDADETIARIAEPALLETAEAIAAAIPNAVPVNQGVARASYRTVVTPATDDEGRAAAHVHVGSPFWHWLEYGTQYNAPYRPVQTAVEGLGVRYEPK